MGSIRETLGLIRDILTSRWYWIIVIMGCAIMITPFIFVLILLYLPTPVNALGMFAIVVGWGVVAGYKDWILEQRAKQKQKSTAVDSIES